MTTYFQGFPYHIFLSFLKQSATNIQDIRDVILLVDIPFQKS